MKNIYIICSSLNIGGAEMQSVWLANKLTTFGFNVNFVVLKNSTMLTKFISRDVNLIEYKMYSENKNKNFVKFRKLYNFLYGSYLLRKKLINRDTIVFTFLFHANIFGFLATFLSSSKHIICIRNDRFSSRSSTSNIWTRNLLISLTSLFSYKIIFNSKKSLAKLNRTLGNKNNHLVIPNAVVNFKDDLDKNILKKLSYFLDGSKTKILSVGRLEPIKNYGNILKAMSILKKSDLDFKFVIFGKGYLEEELKEYINNNDLDDSVLMMGVVKNAVNYMQLFDYFLLASIHEGFPNSLIESMSKGLIPFATDSGDSFEIISNNRGIKIENTQPESIAYSIKNFLDSTEEKSASEIEHNIKNYIQKDLNEANIIKQWLSLIK